MEMIAEALERFSEYMRAEFLEWHINFLKRRMEKMERERSSRPKGCRGKIHIRGV
jgi:hypothetical protein